MQIRTILYQYIKTLIKHVFLLNFTHKLLMSFVSIGKTLLESRKMFIFASYRNGSSFGTKVFDK